MIKFIIIGLMCNSEGCYWAKVSGLTEFTKYDSCVAQASNVKQATIMYFDTACMVKPE